MELNLSFPNSCLGTYSAKLRFAGPHPVGDCARNRSFADGVPKQEFGNERWFELSRGVYSFRNPQWGYFFGLTIGVSSSLPHSAQLR
jgi:hypothetical protein